MFQCSRVAYPSQTKPCLAQVLQSTDQQCCGYCSIVDLPGNPLSQCMCRATQVQHEPSFSIDDSGWVCVMAGEQCITVVRVMLILLLPLFSWAAGPGTLSATDWDSVRYG